MRAAGRRRACAAAALLVLVLTAGCTERGGGHARAGAGDAARPETAASASSAPRPSGPPFSVVAPESAAADREARRALPPALASALAVDDALTDRYIARTPGAECMVQSQTSGTEERRRVHLRLGDGSSFVVFARVDTAERAVRRIEIMRNPVGDEQIAFTLDGEGDVATVIRWPERGHGRAESAEHPRSGPLPRVLRSFARRLWTLKCPAKGPPKSS